MAVLRNAVGRKKSEGTIVIGAPPAAQCAQKLPLYLHGTPPSFSRLDGLSWRPRPTMETSKMLAMESVAAAVLIRALSRQSSHAFITLDSQQGTSLSDSMAYAAVGACLRQA